MSCDCIKRVGEQLKEQGYTLVTMTPITKDLSFGVTRMTTRIERLKPGRKPLPTVSGPFCPFCGQRYEPVPDSALDAGASALAPTLERGSEKGVGE